MISLKFKSKSKPKSKFLVIIILLVGLAFLYLPILTMVIYSFNQSRLVSVWGGWSLHWYSVLFHDPVIGFSTLLSLKIGITAATGGLILGVLLSIIFKRFGVFKGRLFLYGVTLSPLVMPDVITGLSLLLLFNLAMHLFFYPNNIMGFWTIAIAHITFCTAYATIVIQARFQSLDQSIEEAALDLGARPIRTFLTITLPQMIPSLIAAWVMSFTLSLDDLVITSFVSGASNSTLPMTIFARVKTGVTPEINALASILIGVVLIFILVGVVLGRMRKV